MAEGRERRVLVAGWFSFDQMGATAGDLMARDVVCRWLADAGIAYDSAVASTYGDGVDWQQVDPAAYTHLAFVCGPLGNGWPFTDLRQRFAHCPLLGLDLTLLQPLAEWDPFALLLERDSERDARPDFSFACDQPRVPVVGLVLVHPQKEYGNRGRHADVHAAIGRLAESRPMARVAIDTCLDDNASGLRGAAEVEALIASVDLVVTTRLHGLALALKNGVPALAVDPVAGGAKVARQARTLDWPVVLTPEQVTDERLAVEFERCLTDDARRRARRCADGTLHRLASARDEMLTWFSSENPK